jgi:hypothetical protein
MFLYESHVKEKSYKSCKRKLRSKYPVVHVPTVSVIFKLMKKCFEQSFVDNKYTRQNAVLTTQVQVIEQGDYERRTHLVAGVCRQYRRCS